MPSRRKARRVKQHPLPPPLIVDDKTFIDLFSIRRLKSTWATIRKELQQLALRDCTDWIDWVHTVENSLLEIIDDIHAGHYQPSTPTRYELGKTKGSFRYMTLPSVRDSLVFRHISNEILNRAIAHKVKGAYFSRRHSSTPVGPRFEIEEPSYSEFFEIWLRYQEYRTKTLLNSPYEILVITDISNYFDSIQHELLMEYLAPLGLPRKAIALLGRLLETLKPSSGHSPNPRVGLPVDELDCSRQIAHVFLFEHDRRVIERAGEEHYVRWMDDQNIGVKSETEARAMVNTLTRSLCEQRLTLNAGKTLFLTPAQVVKEFHLASNQALTEWEKQWKATNSVSEKSRLRSELKRIWKDTDNPDTGRWEKVLKRFYGYVILTGSRWLDKLALKHLIAYPDLHDRIFESFAKRGEVKGLISLFRQYVVSGECLFEATEAHFFDALLLADATTSNGKACLAIAHDFMRGKLGKTSGRPFGLASAVLCYYWFGGNVKSLPILLKINRWAAVPDAVARAIVAVTFAKSPKSYRDLLPHLVGHPGDDVGRLVQFIDGIHKGRIESIVRFANPKRRWPLPGQHYDARGWLCLEMLAHSPNPKVRNTLRTTHKQFLKLGLTRQEARVSKRVSNLLA